MQHKMEVEDGSRLFLDNDTPGQVKLEVLKDGMLTSVTMSNEDFGRLLATGRILQEHSVDA